MNVAAQPKKTTNTTNVPKTSNVQKGDVDDDEDIETMKLTKADYLKILEYYEIAIPKNSPMSVVREAAEHIIAEKLCRCIKTVKPVIRSPDPTLSAKEKEIEKEHVNSAICTKSIFEGRSLRHFRFSCKKTAKSRKGSRLFPKKGTRTLRLVKTTKNTITFKQRRKMPKAANAANTTNKSS